MYFFYHSAAEAFYKQAIEITQNVFGLEHHSLVKVRIANIHVFIYSLI
jgi:hypothetical protein